MTQTVYILNSERTGLFFFPTLTYKTPEWFFLSFTSQSKISQLCIHVGQVNDNIFWLDISVQDTLFLALNSGIKNLRKKSSSIVFGHPVIDVHDVKQVRRIFGTFEHINEIFFVGENVQELNDVWMTNVALVVSFNGELLAIDLQREKDLSKAVFIHYLNFIFREVCGMVMKPVRVVLLI